MSYNKVNNDGSLTKIAGLVDDTDLKADIAEVQAVIPSDASSSNKLVAKNDALSIKTTTETDLNNITKIGMYFLSGGTNFPTGISYGILEVCKASSGDYIQIIHPTTWNDRTKIYKRNYVSSSWTEWVCFEQATSTVTSGSTAPLTAGGCYDYLAGTPLIGQVVTTLGRLGFGASADNILNIKVCPSDEITNNPFGASGNCLYIQIGIVEFVVGALSADASQWAPNTGVAYRVRHGSVWQSWHTLTQS